MKFVAALCADEFEDASCTDCFAAGLLAEFPATALGELQAQPAVTRLTFASTFPGGMVVIVRRLA